MEINTNDFELPEGEYFKILFSNTLKKNWWFLLLVIAFAVYKASYLLLIALVLYLALVAIEIVFTLNSDENKTLLAKKFCRITGGYLAVHFKNGDFQKIGWESLNRVEKKADAYFLYLSKKNFIYLPFYAFSFPEDRKTFDAFLRERKLLPN